MKLFATDAAPPFSRSRAAPPARDLAVGAAA